MGRLGDVEFASNRTASKGTRRVKSITKKTETMSSVPTHSNFRIHDEVFSRRTSLLERKFAPNGKAKHLGQTYQSKEPQTPTGFPIIVHSHLCWDWVWQRPQQFMSRLSEKHRILFVETVGPDPHLAAPMAR